MLRAAALLLVSAAVSAQPSLDQFSISKDGLEGGPLVFNVTEASQPLHVFIAASSQGSEVDGISISMTVHNHFGGTATHTIPSIPPPSATISYALPRFLETGTYEVNVAIRDARGQSRRWTVDELAQAGLPNRFEVRVTNDFYAPEVAGIEIENVEDAFAPEGLARITFSDPSGILAYRVLAESPSGRRQTIGEYQAPIGVGPSHTFDLPFTLVRDVEEDEPAEEGLWRIAEIWVSDSNGTAHTLYGNDLFNLGFQTAFWVGPVPPEPAPEPGCGWPNPVRAGRAVSVPASAYVYDVRGRRVGRADVYGTLDTGDLSPGLYLARATGEEAETCRFTVSRR